MRRVNWRVVFLDKNFFFSSEEDMEFFDQNLSLLYVQIHYRLKGFFMRKLSLLLLGVMGIVCADEVNTQDLVAQDAKYQSNDLVQSAVQANPDTGNIDLMEYLTGNWKLEGEWRIVEGGIQQNYITSARISGSETYTPSLDNHFLQKRFEGTVKYFSKIKQNKEMEKFSTVTMLTFNNDLSRFFYWYFDSSGNVMEAGGNYNEKEQEYQFFTRSLNPQGRMVDTIFAIKIMDSDHYNWAVREQNLASGDWEVAASGMSTRSKKKQSQLY